MKYFSFIISIFFVLQFQAQFQFDNNIEKDNCRHGENVEYCRTHKVMNFFKLHSSLMKIYEEEQSQLRIIEDSMKLQAPSRVVYTIPLVFHVLHNGGSENISRAQIEDAVAILNRDFRLQNQDANNVVSTFQGMPSDIEVEFQLAIRAPNGQCFSGITRTQSPFTNDGSNGMTQVSAIISGNNVYNGSWPGNKYLNIFVVNDAGGAAGYTTNPSIFTGSSMNNGIWVLHDYVGSIGTSDLYSSRTLTHEVGHWLNLDHLWGNNNNPGNASSCTQDDAVDDTPRCIGVTSCNVSSNTCSNDAVDGYWTTDVVDNIENYLEYSYCSKMFTPGQKSRMRAALVSGVAGRNNLWSSSNHTATGLNQTPTICDVDIRSNRNMVCGGDVVEFFDESYNNVNSWSWSFPGGSPSTSTQQNPTVTYANAGTYDVQLQVSDQFGNQLSQNFPNFITVIANPGDLTPFVDDFESATQIPNSDWSVYNPEGPGFHVMNSSSFSGSYAVKLDNSAAIPGSVDELVSTTLDISNLSSASLSFKYAFAKRNSQNTDFMQVLASRDCGETWFLRKNIPASTIATYPNTNSSYNPSVNDWNTVNVSGITSVYLVSDFRFKIKFTSGGGNDLFIDDINLSGPLSIEDELVFDFLVYPNPANTLAVLKFNLSSMVDDASIKIVDPLGRVVYGLDNQTYNPGLNEIELNVRNLNPGWYNVIFDSPKRKISTKMMINN